MQRINYYNKSNLKEKYNNRRNVITFDKEELQKEYLELADMIEKIVEYLEHNHIDRRNYMYADITKEKVANMLQIILDSFYSRR